MAELYHGPAMDSLTEPKKQFKDIKTVALCSVFLGMGLANSVIGPTLVSMEILLGTDTKSISATFTGGALGYLTGALSCGFIYSRINKELLFVVSQAAVSMALALAPWSPNLLFFVAADFVRCLGMSLVDTAGQVYILKLWAGQGAKKPIMQTLHGVWSIGATIGPFIMKPFLLDVSILNGHYSMNSSNMSILVHSLNGTKQLENTLMNMTDSSPDWKELERLKERVSFVRYGYEVIALLILATTFLFIVVFILGGPSCEDHYQKTKKEEGKHVKHPNKTFKIHLLIFMFSYIFFYLWVEQIPGSLLAAYVVKELKWPNGYGALITAAYWGSHGAIRILCIPFSAILKPQNMLIINFIITSSGFIVLFFAPYHDYLMWLGVVMAGLGMGTTFPTTLLWLEEQMEITGVAASVLLTAASAGDMTGPLLTGLLFTDFSHSWFIYMSFSASLLMILIFITAYIFVRIKGSRLAEEYTVLDEEILPVKNKKDLYLKSLSKSENR